MPARFPAFLRYRLLTLGAFFALFTSPAHAATQVVAYYDFGTITSGTAAPPILPTSGNGSITFSGFAAANLVYFTGTTVNAQPGDTAGACLALQNGTANVNNGGFLQLSVNATGLSGLVLSLATQKSSAAGFSSNQISYSSNGGTTFTAFGSPYNPVLSFAALTFDLSAITALNNNAADVFRITFSGATGSTNNINNRIDNLTVVGTLSGLPTAYNYNNNGAPFSSGFTAAIPAAGTTTADALVFGGAAYTATDDLTSAQPLNANVVTFSNTGAVILSRGAGQNLLTLSGTAPTVNLNNSGTLGIALDMALAADASFAGTGSAAVSGVISGAGGLAKNGTGTLTLSGANTYTGLTTVGGGGTLQIGADNAILSGNSLQLTAFSGGARLDLNGHNLTLDMLTASSVRTDSATQVNGGGILTIGVGNSSFSYYSVLGASNASGLTLVKNGTGTVTLGDTANNYGGGTIVNGGTLQAGNDNVFGASGNALTINTGGTLEMNGYNEAFGALSGTGGTLVNTGGTAANLTVGNGNASGAYAGVIADDPVSGSAIALVKNGSGTQTLTGANTWTGGTTINAGTLSVRPASLGGGTVSTAANGVLDLEGGTGTIANQITGAGSVSQGGTNAGANVSAGAIITLTASNSYTAGTTIYAGTLSGGAGSFGSGTVTVGANGMVDYTQSGNGTVSNSITGAGSASFGGSAASPNGTGGTITYTGADSAAGGTTISSGTLVLNRTGGSAMTGPVSVATGGTLELGTDNQIQQPGTSSLTLAGGTIKANGHSEGTPAAAALGSLVLVNTSSILDFGDPAGGSANVLAFADSASLAWTGTVQLTNYTDGIDALYIGATNDLTPSQLSAITFNGISASQLPSGQITFATAAPEPNGIVSMLVGAILLAWAVARRRHMHPKPVSERAFFMSSRFYPARAAVVLGLLCAAILGTSGRVSAQPKHSLTGTVPAAVAHASAVTHVSPSQSLRLALTLPLRNQDALDDLLHGLYDPNDPRFGQYLTPAEFAAQFSPTPQDYNRVMNYAKSLGLIITAMHSNRTVLDVRGSAAAIERAFHVQLLNYRSPQTGAAFYAPSGNPSVDAALASVISGVVGLDNATLRRPHYRKLQGQTDGFLQSHVLPFATGSGPGGGLTPADIKTAYNLNSVTQTGSGQTLALFELDGYAAADITFYENYFSLPHVTLQNVFVDGYSGAAGSGADEVTLDIELQIALAPGATKVIVYEGPNTSAGVIDTYNRIATDNLAKQISTSWGESETSATASERNSENTAFQQMAAQGQSIFAAAGDSGANDNGSSLSVDDPASQPYMVGVGGTALSTNGAGGAYGSETTWNGGSTANGAGGGGISTVWTIPVWQQGIVSVASKGSTTKRNVPDVALDSDPNTGYAIYVGGAWQVFGGTSCAAPLWSAFTALVNQKRVAAGSAVLGFPNPPIYTIATGSAYASSFHDIADGSTNLYYPAVSGFDDATGWGTFNGAGLLTALSAGTITPPAPAAPTNLTATPGSAKVTLAWTASSGAKSYSIYRGTSAGGESATAVAVGVTGTSYVNTGLTNNTTYYYKITAANTGGQSAKSTEASAKPTATVAIPAAPTNLTAVAGSAQIALTWTASANATSYSIYRGTSAGGESTTAIATGITTNSYSSTGLANGTTYYYKVSAVNTGGESAKSNEASATPAALTVTQLLGNPGFENGSASIAPWVTTSGLGAGVVSNSSAEPPFGGDWDAWLCGYGQTDTDTLYQSVTIPAGITTATLTFNLHVDTAETGVSAVDTLAVQVRSSSGTVLATLATYSNLNATRAYAKKTFDLSAYKGQTVQIFLTGTENSRRQTSFVVDDFALNVQ